jgi:hypothetical protein
MKIFQRCDKKTRLLAFNKIRKEASRERKKFFGQKFFFYLNAFHPKPFHSKFIVFHKITLANQWPVL